MPTSQNPIHVGVLFSETGVTAVVERTQRNAVLIAIEEVNAAGGIDGREVKAIAPDPASDPRRYGEAAAELLDEGVRIIFGCYMSSTRRAVLPLIERRDALLFYPTLYEGFEYSRNCVYSGAAPNQNSLGLADHLTSHIDQRFLCVGSNYVFPYESNRIMRDLLQNRGASIVEERYLPLRPSEEEIASVIALVRKHAPVTIFSTIVGDGVTAFYRAYDNAGFDRSIAPIASLTTGEPELNAMGVSAAEMHITSAPYFSSVDRQESHDFVGRYRARHGADAAISACTEAAYFQVHLFAEAARRTGSEDPKRILAALPTFSFDAPQGAVQVDSRTNHTHLWPRLARVSSRGTFEIIEEARAPVRPDPYMVEPGHDGWDDEAAVQ
ncbi:MAG: transporter substrate-binding domain-containing protein [Pseudomonadota bacterium]